MLTLLLLMAVSTVSSTTSRYKHIVFSDVDGTLVHYPTTIPPSDADDDLLSTLHLPPSKTGTRGVLSTHTLTLCHRLRNGGYSSIDNTDIPARRVPLVLISGMRTTTLFQRLPYLPRADAYVSESGGRIFYPRKTITTTTLVREEEDKEAEEELAAMRKEKKQERQMRQQQLEAAWEEG